MDTRLRVARIVLTIPAIHVVFVPPIADLNASHVFNPLWTGHARLHTVWLLSTTSLVGLVALWQLWISPGHDLRRAIRLAGTLVATVLAGFFIAGGTQALYGGSLTDPNGAGRSILGLDPNLAVFSVHLLLLVVSLALTRETAA